MITLKRTISDNPDFIYLTGLFDDYLVEIDGHEKDFFAQYNRIYINNVLIAYEIIMEVFFFFLTRNP